MERTFFHGFAGWLLFACLVGALWQTQRWLDGTRERREYLAERPLQDLPAPEVVSDYVCSLCLGGFRSLAVDALNARQQRLQEEEMYDERLAINGMIARLQPHLAIVWDFYSYDMAYNISWQQEEREQRWKWVQEGLDYLAEGRRRNPSSSLLAQRTAEMYFNRIPQEEFLRRMVRRTTQNPEEPGKPAECYQLAAYWYAKARELYAKESERRGRGKEFMVNWEGMRIGARYELGVDYLGLAIAAAREGRGAEAEGLLAEADAALIAASKEAADTATWSGDFVFYRSRAEMYRELAFSRTILAPSLLDGTRVLVERLGKAPSSREAIWPGDFLANARMEVLRWQSPAVPQRLDTKPIQYLVMQVVFDSLAEGYALWDAGKTEKAKAVFESRAQFAEGFLPSDPGWGEFARGIRSLVASLSKEKSAPAEARRMLVLFIDRSLPLNVDRFRDRLARLPR